MLSAVAFMHFLLLHSKPESLSVHATKNQRSRWCPLLQNATQYFCATAWDSCVALIHRERGECVWNHLITPESARDMTGEPQSLFKTGPQPQTVQRKHNPLSTAPDDTQNTAHVQRARVTARDNVTLKQIAKRGGLHEWKRERQCWIDSAELHIH